MKEVTIIGASLEESVKVRCEVDADPSEVDFVWEFNNSGENFEVAPAKFDGNNGTTSELVYTPESERDYGALTCWGRNAIGKQEAPCVYQVIPAGMMFSTARYLQKERRKGRKTGEIGNRIEGNLFSTAFLPLSTMITTVVIRRKSKPSLPTLRSDKQTNVSSGF